MKTKQFLLIVLACLCIPFTQLWSNPVNGLLERIDPGCKETWHQVWHLDRTGNGKHYQRII